MLSLREKLKFRESVVSGLRLFLKQKQYLEADVPVLSPNLIPESYLEIFETHLTSPDLKEKKIAYLLASPEAYLKRLLSSGVGNVYSLGKAFRNNEPMGKNHNHEFTILEWYKIGFDYLELMKEIEQMLQFVLSNTNTSSRVNFQSPWEYMTIEEAYSRFAPGEHLRLETFEKVYVQYLEPNLGTRGKPTFVYSFPAWQSPLAKAKGGLAERFELYINGLELINGWTELTDWTVQLENLQKENQIRKSLGKEFLPLDTGFVESLKSGMPECAGAAMGVDRLLMALGGYASLSDVILFPTKKLLGKK